MTESEWRSCSNPQQMLGFLGDRISPRKLRLLALAQTCRFTSETWSEVEPECRELLAAAYDNAEVIRDRVDSEFDEEALEASQEKLEDLCEEVASVFQLPWTEFLEPNEVFWTTSDFSIDKLRLWAARDLAVICANPDPRVAATRSFELVVEYGLRNAVLEQLASGEIVEGEDEYPNHLEERGKGVVRSTIEPPLRTSLAEWVREIVGNPLRKLGRDSAWMTPSVIAVALAVYEEQTFGDLPILADALEDAGCYEGELLKHLRSDTRHARGCWALDLLLDKR